MVRGCRKRGGGQVSKELQRGILKGRLLSKNPIVRLRVFQKLASPTLKWHAFVTLFDKRRLRPRLPESDGRRYALLFRNVFLSSYSIPRKQRFIPLIVDRRYPRTEGRKQFDQMILATFHRMRKTGSKALLWVFHHEPEHDTPIQFADWLANFGLQRLRLGEPLPARSYSKQASEDQREREADLQEWQQAFEAINGKLSWRKPGYFRRGLPPAFRSLTYWFRSRYWQPPGICYTQIKSWRRDYPAAWIWLARLERVSVVTEL